jgi:uncharacterized membrane protein HdeD (DUF308 family)
MTDSSNCCEIEKQLHDEFRHVRSCWLCFLLLGVLLVICGTTAIVVPPLTVASTFITVLVLGLLLMVGGIVTIVSSFWIGKSSGLLMHLLVGILYLVTGFIITERPAETAALTTLFIAATFIVLGAFRIASSIALRFPQWGWIMLNGIITMLFGIVIYRHVQEAKFWLIGLIVGMELLFNGVSWIMLSLAIKKIPSEQPVG